MTSAAFPRPARLLTPADFQRVFAKGRRINSPQLQLIVHLRESRVPEADSHADATPDALPARIGLTVAKRVAKRAVDRNRIKRVARDSFRHHKDQLAGLDLVLVARSGIADLPRTALHDVLETLWQRARTLKPGPSPVKLAPPDESGRAACVTATPVTTAKRDPSS